MKKLVLVLVALALPAVASAATPTTLHLTERQTFQHYVDNGAKGESAGDVRTFGGVVFLNGTKVGRDRIHCIVGAACDAHVWLPGGSLISKSFVAKGPSFTAPITSGTGKYSGVHGTARIVSGRITHYTVRLSG
jgi:hypothetical protein